MDNRKISIAIPTYNRGRMPIDAVLPVINDSRIYEVVITDDGSNIDSLNELQNAAKQYDKIRIAVELDNVGVYLNKRRAVLNARCDWVVLFDSDNTLTPEYIDAIFNEPIWKPECAYCPEFARPHFDYREFAQETIRPDNVAQFYPRKQFDCLLNTMNYFVNRLRFLHVHNESAPNPMAADSIYINADWLEQGNYLYVVPGMQYEHLVHNGSNYQKEAKLSGKIMAETVARIKAMK